MTVDCLKVDDEGAEIDVLEGASGLLARGMVHRVVVETHCDELVSKTMDYLTSFGFRAVTLDVFPSFFVGHPCLTVFGLGGAPLLRPNTTSGELEGEKLINPGL
jgi:hypothetical protein